MYIILQNLKPFLIVLHIVWTNIAIAQMGLHGNLYLFDSHSLAIENVPLYFNEGIIQSEKNTSDLVFLGTAQALNASEQSHSHSHFDRSGEISEVEKSQFLILY